MRVFQSPNSACDWVCPICKKNTDFPVVLIGIVGTESGGNIKAEQFHLDCIELTYLKGFDVIIQNFKV